MAVTREGREELAWRLHNLFLSSIRGQDIADDLVRLAYPPPKAKEIIEEYGMSIEVVVHAIMASTRISDGPFDAWAEAIAEWDLI